MWTAEVDAGLAQLLSQLLGIPVQWRGEPQTMHVGASATIDSLSEGGVGFAETVYARASAGVLVPSTHTQHETTLQLSVWSPSQGPGQAARAYTSRLRTLIELESTTAQLSALGLGLIELGESVQADVEQTGRDRSGSIIDIRLSFGRVETDAPLPSLQAVRVHTTGEGAGLSNAAGTRYGDPLQIDTHPPTPEP